VSCGRQPIERREAGPHRSRRWHPPHTRAVFSETRRRLPYLIGTSFVLLLGALGAQQVPSFKSGVDVVLIDVTVVDPTGRPVTDLKSEDFRITVDRKPRTIASATFIRHDTRTSVTALPEGSRATPTGSPRRGSVPVAMTRNVLIVIDTDSMEPGDGLLVRKAVKGFLDQLAPDDRVGVATVPWLKSEVELSRLRSGARKLLDSVTTGNERFRSGEFKIGVSEAYEAVLRKDAEVMQRLIRRNCGSRDSNCPKQVQMETHQVATQEQYRSQRTFDALSDIGTGLRQVPGPKTLVFVTGGLPPPDLYGVAAYTRLASGLAAAQVTLYTLYIEQPEYGQVKYQMSPTPTADQALEQEGAANATAAAGGTFVEVVGTIEPRFSRIAMELSASYLLGVEVDASDRDGRTHYVDVKVNRAHVEVRARKQYVIEPAASPKAVGAKRPAETSAPARSVVHMTSPEVKAVIVRASDYVARYQVELAGFVSEERYTQRQYRLQPLAGLTKLSARDGESLTQWVPETDRTMKSDYLLVHPTGKGGWIPFRDVFEVDGKKVRDREERLQKLFLEQPATARALAGQLHAESARFNMGFVERNVNIPTLALTFVDGAHRERFTFTKIGESKVRGTKVWEIEFHEWQTPTVVRDDAHDRDLPTDGVMLIDPVTGRVARTTMRLRVDESTTEEVTVTYAPTAKSGDLWLPADMRELYVGRDRKLECEATYTNIRRFQVSTEVRLP
jgi:VWFA-related protein